MIKRDWRRQKFYLLLFLAWAVFYFLFKGGVPGYLIISTVVLFVALMLLLNKLILKNGKLSEND
ncbi:MAG: hypothetical protein KC506_01400 [Nanoarchaeota archaeon]|nr:hypothetical protein [Nanoarchaeota archaeon]